MCWVQGAFELAVPYRDQALAAAKHLNNPFDLAYAGCFAAMFDNIRGEFASAAQRAATTVQLSREHGFGVWLVAGDLHLTIAKGLLGQMSDAIDVLTALLNTWRAGGAELNRPFFLAGLAQKLAVNGRIDEALVAIDDAIEHAHLHNEHLYTAMLHRLRGELLKRKDPPRRKQPRPR